MRNVLYFVGLVLISSCSKNELTQCQERIIGNWNVHEHYVVLKFDTLSTDYTNEFQMEFYKKGNGRTFRPMRVEEFDWVCTDSSITFFKDESYYLDHGEYTVQLNNPTSITLDKHSIIKGKLLSGDSINIESRRTWILTKG